MTRISSILSLADMIRKVNELRHNAIKNVNQQSLWDEVSEYEDQINSIEDQICDYPQRVNYEFIIQLAEELREKGLK